MTRRATLVLCLLTAGCASPLGGEDLEFGAGASGLPKIGTLVSFSQRMHTADWGRLDFEADYTHQELDEATNDQGRTGDDLNQFRVGLRWRREPEEPATLTARAGIVWLRAQGDLEYLDEPNDYGGGYVGLGYEFPLGQHLVTGPDLTLLVLDAEGTGDSGVQPQLAWRFQWKL